MVSCNTDYNKSQFHRKVVVGTIGEIDTVDN